MFPGRMSAWATIYTIWSVFRSSAASISFQTSHFSQLSGRDISRAEYSFDPSNPLQREILAHYVHVFTASAPRGVRLR